MFEVAMDGEHSDYMAEGLPKEFEMLQEDVLVLQSREFEMGDVEFIMESIGSSLKDLVSVGYHRLQLETAKKAESMADRIRAMSNARDNRERLQVRYGSAVILTKEEAVNLASPTFALEEEEAKERGLFRRILDKIVAGFKWLWDKLAGLFASGDDPEKNQEQTDKAVKEIEEAIAAGVDLKDIEPDNAGVRAAFGFLGDPVTAHAIAEHLVKMGDAYSHLKLLMEAGTRSYDIMIETLRGIDADAERFISVGSKVISTVRSGAAGLEHGSASDLTSTSGEGASNFKSFLDTHKDLQIFKLTKFVGDGLFMLAISPEVDLNGKGVFSSIFIPGSKDFAAKVKVEAFDKNGIDVIQAAAGRLSKISKDTGAALTKIVKANESRQNNLQASVNIFAESKVEGTTQAAQFLFTLGNSISQLFIQAQHLNEALRGSNRETRKYLECINAATKKALKAKKETT